MVIGPTPSVVVLPNAATANAAEPAVMVVAVIEALDQAVMHVIPDVIRPLMQRVLLVMHPLPDSRRAVVISQNRVAADVSRLVVIRQKRRIPMNRVGRTEVVVLQSLTLRSHVLE
jgi:hypothetical protein